MNETRKVKLTVVGLILKLVIYFFLSWAIIPIFLAIRDLIRYFTTHLEFNDKHIHGKIGLIRTQEMDMPLKQVNGIYIKQGIIGHLLNYGSLVISSNSLEYRFDYIDNPKAVKNDLMQRIDKC